MYESTGALETKIGVAQNWGGIEGSLPQVTYYSRFTHLVKDALRFLSFHFRFANEDTQRPEDYLKRETAK
eukprot:9440221-Pyramimonas_sp.AAC.1